MDNPDDETTIVNVKGVSVRSWNTFKTLATKHGEPMGALLSRMIDQFANQDIGPRELLPSVPANPAREMGNPPDQDAALANLLTAVAAVSAANERQIRTVPGLVALLRDRVREARGLPPLPAKTPRGDKIKGQGQICLSEMAGGGP